MKIIAKDVLTLTNTAKAQCPEASTGTLSADITTESMSFTLEPAGVGNDEYEASGTLRLGGEELTFTRVADAITVTARAVNGTELKEHKTGDIVQQCKVFSNINVVDAVDDLLNNYVTGFQGSWIPYDQGISGGATGTNELWDDEKETWLSYGTVTRTISKPMAVNKLLAELTEQFLFNLFWHETDQE